MFHFVRLIMRSIAPCSHGVVIHLLKVYFRHDIRPIASNDNNKQNEYRVQVYTNYKEVN